MIDHFEPRGPIRHDKAIEPPFALENLSLQEGISGGRDTVHDIECIHHRARIGALHGRTKRGKHDIEKRRGAEVDRIVVPARF